MTADVLPLVKPDVRISRIRLSPQSCIRHSMASFLYLQVIADNYTDFFSCQFRHLRTSAHLSQYIP